MSLHSSLLDIFELSIPDAFECFANTLDAEWIDTALTETGKASVRKRKIPAELVVWLVIGMALFRDRSIQEVVAHLGLVLPSEKRKGKGAAGAKSIAPSAIPQGRYRLGAAPIESIFWHTAKTWADDAAENDRWRGLSIYGVDGTTFKVPDTEENRDAFTLPGSSRGQAGYPQVRLVALMALRSHLISAIAFGPYSGKKTSEQILAQQLWPELPDNSLVILDKGFVNYGNFYRLSYDANGINSKTKHWLIRGKDNFKGKTVEILGNGDELVELSISSQARKTDPSLPQKLIVRAINYQIKGHRPQVLLTSLLDAEKYPALELALLYHERWELELGYDEIKTHMLERQEALRSKKPEGVKQEIWGVFVAYNLVRKEMLTVAKAAGVAPNRISFRHSLQFIRVFCMVEAWGCSPGNIPNRITSHLEMMQSLLILPERRRQRKYARQVKIKMSKYKRNPGRPIAKDQK